ncbi:MAG: hypothetical protein KC493_17050 [Bacteriovoracaceae bacterium]|nr:hypothetical protein [Bacteriovoracaceae bacterium]
MDTKEISKLKQLTIEKDLSWSKMDPIDKELLDLIPLSDKALLNASKCFYSKKPVLGNKYFLIRIALQPILPGDTDMGNVYDPADIFFITFKEDGSSTIKEITFDMLYDVENDENGLFVKKDLTELAHFFNEINSSVEHNNFISEVEKWKNKSQS